MINGQTAPIVMDGWFSVPLAGYWRTLEQPMTASALARWGGFFILCPIRAQFPWELTGSDLCDILSMVLPVTR